MIKKLLATTAAGAAATMLIASPAAADHEGAVYTGTLSELNGSGASGEATLTVSEDGETLYVEIEGDGFNLDGPHAMHLHGIVEDDEVLASTCPTMDDDADGDGVLTVLEGAPKYGAVQLSLTTEGDTSPDSALAVDRFPAGTSIDYSRDAIPIPDVLKPNLGMLHVVVHGIDENGNGELDLDQEERSSLTDDLPREGTAPALCGTLAIQPGGPIQTGAGGLATGDAAGDATSTGLLAGLGFGAAVMAAATVVPARIRGRVANR